jgi:hypothetical protein
MGACLGKGGEGGGGGGGGDADGKVRIIVCVFVVFVVLVQLFGFSKEFVANVPKWKINLSAPPASLYICVYSLLVLLLFVVWSQTGL